MLVVMVCTQPVADVDVMKVCTAAVATLRDEATSDRLTAESRRLFQCLRRDGKPRFANKRSELGLYSARLRRPETSTPAGVRLRKLPRQVCPTP